MYNISYIEKIIHEVRRIMNNKIYLILLFTCEVLYLI